MEYSVFQKREELLLIKTHTHTNYKTNNYCLLNHTPCEMRKRWQRFYLSPNYNKSISRFVIYQPDGFIELLIKMERHGVIVNGLLRVRISNLKRFYYGSLSDVRKRFCITLSSIRITPPACSRSTTHLFLRHLWATFSRVCIGEPFLIFCYSLFSVLTGIGESSLLNDFCEFSLYIIISDILDRVGCSISPPNCHKISSLLNFLCYPCNRCFCGDIGSAHLTSKLFTSCTTCPLSKSPRRRLSFSMVDFKSYFIILNYQKVSFPLIWYKIEIKESSETLLEPVRGPSLSSIWSLLQ